MGSIAVPVRCLSLEYHVNVYHLLYKLYGTISYMVVRDVAAHTGAAFPHMIYTLIAWLAVKPPHQLCRRCPATKNWISGSAYQLLPWYVYI